MDTLRRLVPRGSSIDRALVTMCPTGKVFHVHTQERYENGLDIDDLHGALFEFAYRVRTEHVRKSTGFGDKFEFVDGDVRVHIIYANKMACLITVVHAEKTDTESSVPEDKQDVSP